MPKKTTKQQAIMTLYEKVDTNILARLIGSPQLDQQEKNMLYEYRKKVISGPSSKATINYHYAEGKIKNGRLYAEGGLSLQSFKKAIRHTLAKDIYIDIDMVNAHPVLLKQYCDFNDIECKYLHRYVKNRDKWLSELMEHHEIDRNKAKTLMLRLCYLGNYIIDDEEPADKIDKVVKFSEELKRIAKEVCKIEKEVTKVVKKDETKENIRSSVLSITAQILENNCLQSMKAFFKKKGLEVGVLCFDGLMVEKTATFGPDETYTTRILRECEEYVKQRTEYQISLDVKPMELGMEVPQFDEFVDDDKDVQEKLFLLENPNFFKYCDKTLYVFNELTGKYDDCEKDESALNHYICKHAEYFKYETSINPDYSRLKSYGRDASLMKKVIPFVKIASSDPEWLDETAHTSRGYLLFKDGIYNMYTGQFTKGFNPDIVFHGRIPHNFPKRKQKYVDYANELSFKKLFDNPEPIKVALSKALAGESHKIKEFYLCPGKTNAGKSKLINMMQTAFGKQYIRSFNAESLALRGNNDSRDEGARNRWTYLLRFARVIFSNEISMDKSLDGNAIKKIAGGGDEVVGRTHGKEEVEFKPHFLAFCMLNDIPKIEPMEDAVYERLRYCEFPKQFSMKPTKPNELQADPNLDEKIKEDKFISGFIHLILDAFQYYLENGQPEFDQKTKEEWTDGNKQDGGIEDIIEKYYDITNDSKDYIEVSEITEFKKQHKNEIGPISQKRFNEILKNMGLQQDRVGKKSTRVWRCIRKKRDDDVIEI